MKLYIWKDFCPDWSTGLAFAIAKDDADAMQQIRAEYGGEPYQWGDMEVKRTDRRTARCVCGGG